MKKNNQVKFFLFYIVPIFVWMGIIFYFSSLQGDGARWKPNIWFYAERKGAHVVEYAVLTFLILRSLLAGAKGKKDALKIVILSGLLSLLYAFSDEIHQSFVFGREGKISDVGIDLVGILIVSLIILKFRESRIIKPLLA